MIEYRVKLKLPVCWSIEDPMDIIILTQGMIQ